MGPFLCDHDNVVDLSTHRHGPDCGHEQVAHDDHYDYVGDDGMLHHLLQHADCCEQHANVASDHDPLVVSHGPFSNLLHRRKSLPSGSSSSTASPKKRLIERSTAMCMGSDCTLPCCVGGAPINFEDGDGIITKIYCEGICCPMEIPVVEAALHRIPGVISVEVAVVTKTVTAKHVPTLASPAALVAALQEARLGASLTFPRQQNVGKRSWLPPWYVNISVVLLIISLFHYLSGPLNASWLYNFKWIALGPVALCLPRIALKAFGALRHCVLDIHFLITLAAAGAIAIGDYSEASVVVVLFCIADFLEERCTGQARDAISAVLALKPDNAVLAATGEEVPAVEVPPGTLIIIRAGDKAPLDGVVVTGTSAFDESILTGESVAVVKHPGDTVSAGILNAGSGVVHVRTTATSDETFVAGMARLVEQATSSQSPAEAAVAKFAKIYTPIVLFSCILLAFIPWSDPNADRKWWVYLSLQLLVTACPCALVLSTPVTIISALARAAQVGVLIKGGVVLETLRDVKVVTLDKTGTLTVGAFLVDEVSMVSDIGTPHTNSTSGIGAYYSGGVIEKEEVGEKDVLRLVASLERGCNHPLAAALVGRAAARGVACDAEVHGSSIVAGFGIMGIVDGHAVRAGTAEFIRQGFRSNKEKLTSSTEKNVDEQKEIAQLDADAARFEDGGVTTCFIAVDGRYIACITARDSLRPEAAEAVASLRALDITPAMLTGDNASVARAIGVAAGIELDHIHAALLPQDKLDLVSAYNVDLFQTYDHRQRSRSGVSYNLKRIFDRTVDVLFFWRRWGTTSRRKKPKIRVAHVGDGVNDAPALAAADVGISMGVAGAAAALEAGDVALFTNDLRVVPALQRLARAAGNKIVFNISLAVVTKLIVLVLAAMGKFTLFGAVLVDVGSALLVTLNGLTLLRWDFGLGESPAGCVGTAAAAAAAATTVSTTAGQCCRTKGCCATKPEKEEKSSACASSTCKSKACCSVAIDTNKDIEGGTACCDHSAEEAQPASCCAHGHHHHPGHETKHHSHNKSHKEHTHGAEHHKIDQRHSHSLGNGIGGCCGHEHDHHNDHHHTEEHSPSRDDNDTKTLFGSEKSCCSGHTHH